MNPGLMIIGIGISAAVVFVLFYMWSEGVFSTADSLVMGIVLCSMAMGMAGAPSLWRFLLAFIPFVGTVAYLIYMYKAGGLKAFYRQQCLHYWEIVNEEPRNVAAREFLAQALHNSGKLDEAVVELQNAIGLQPNPESEYTLNQWKKEKMRRDGDEPICRWCDAQNVKGARHCSRCGGELPYISGMSRWMVRGKTAKSRYFLMLIVWLALICLSLTFAPPIFVLLPLALGLIGLIGWSFLNSASG